MPKITKRSFICCPICRKTTFPPSYKFCPYCGFKFRDNPLASDNDYYVRIYEDGTCRISCPPSKADKWLRIMRTKP